jgi:hypothetical protein
MANERKCRRDFRVLWGVLFVLFGVMAGRAQAFDHFVTARHGMLMDGTSPLRFISFNVPNLNYTEDDMRFTQVNPYRLPTEFEMRDVFATVKQMGGQLVRIYTIPVKNDAFPSDAPTYVLAPGKFDEAAFRRLDLMMALANEYGVRIIFPLVNNWPWMGGRPQYAAFRGKKADDFWTDPQLIADFEATIRHLLERKNTITGVVYKDDKAILCWETGNELSAPFTWTVHVTRFIKSLDRNHLVMDGSRGDVRNEVPSVQAGALREPSIDIVTTHHYERDALVIPGHIQKNIDTIRRRKVYVVGEFGFAPTAANKTILDKVIADKNDIAGALVWSLRFHDQDGGFYWHSEPFGDRVYEALHWPGFIVNDAYDEAQMMTMIRDEAFAILGKEPPALEAPAAPELLPVEDISAITWRGSVGATGYNIERATSPSGPWERVGYNVSDAVSPCFPLFDDTSARVGSAYYYRAVAINSAGASPPSRVVGPVRVTYQVKLDTMTNLGRTESSRGVKPVTGDNRSYKEIRTRLAGGMGAELVYSVPGRLKSFELYAFEETSAAVLQILGSVDGRSWQDLQVAPSSFASSESNYRYWIPKIYRTDVAGSPKFIKVVFKNGAAQLARARIVYTPQ